MSLISRLLRQPKTRYTPTPDDLTVLKSGAVMVKVQAPNGEKRDELDHMWYQVEEREAGGVYSGYKVVELLMLRYLPQDAKRSGSAKGVIYAITPGSLKAARFAFLDLTTSRQASAWFVFQPVPNGPPSIAAQADEAQS